MRTMAVYAMYFRGLDCHKVLDALFKLIFGPYPTGELTTPYSAEVGVIPLHLLSIFPSTPSTPRFSAL